MIREKFADGPWALGKFVLGGKAYSYEVKRYDEPSKYGIRYGRISKLHIKDAAGNTVAAYDRGWDVKPGKDDTDVLSVVIKKYDPQTYKKAYSKTKSRSLVSDLKLPTQKMLNQGIRRLKKMF